MSKITLGQTVTYVSATTGNRKAALVIATPEDTREGTSLTVAKGTANVLVFNPRTGASTVREGVIVGQKRFDKQAAKAGEVVEDEFGYETYREAPKAFLEV